MKKLIDRGCGMKKILFILLTTGFSINAVAQDTVIRRAEDLWGNVVQFDNIIQSSKPVLIQPFSSSNCGYCLIDGCFVEKNYFETNREKGGMNFTQCLFNPQLDVDAFIRHYRDSLTAILTYPPELHQYHQDGFPAILAFRNGRQIVKLPQGYLSPYDSMFDVLKMTIWNDSTLKFKPVSDLQFATRLIYENEHYKAVCIIPDGDVKRHDLQIEFASRAKCYLVKYLSEVSKSDLQHHVYLEGKFTEGFKGILNDVDSPFRIQGDSLLLIGKHRFSLDTIAFSACLPNPANPEKYLVLNIRGGKCGKGYLDTSVDFTVSVTKPGSGKPGILMQGFFDKSKGNHWVFSDSLAFSAVRDSHVCKTICKIPPGKYFPPHDVMIAPPVKKAFPYGEEYILGAAGCRFPSMVSDHKGRIWVSWEEHGDILLSSLDNKKPVSMAVECDRTQSYNPLLTVCGSKLWIFYLNNRDGFYRLYGRIFDGRGLSDPVLFSEVLPCDAVTPAVITNKKNEIALAWTAWKSNFRYPFYRMLRNDILDSIRPWNVVKSASLPDYTNAWWISLASDTSGLFWAAWNQHYPASLGVCAGDAGGIPSPVTKISDNIDDCENGGYAFAVTDKNNKRWVFRESFGWDVLEGRTQKIYAATYDDASRSWTLPTELTSGSATYLNQTPQAAVDRQGRIWVVWSGRSREKGTDWGLYLVYRDKEKWSDPLRISGSDEPARASKITTDPSGNIWLCCHYGKGENMKVQVLRLSRKKFPVLVK